MLPRERNKIRLSIPMILALSLLIVFTLGLFAPRSVRAEDKTYGTVKLKQGDTKQLKLMFADAPKVLWSSSNTNVCVVNNSGFVQTLGGGNCTVTAVVAGNTFRWPIQVTPLKLNKTSLQLVTRRKGFALTLNSKNARNGAQWSSSHPSIASVSGSGFVTPHAAGNCVITASWNNIRLSCSVKVQDANPSSLRQYRSPKDSSNRGRVIVAGSGLMDYWTDVYNAFGSTTVINNAVSMTDFAFWLGNYRKLITDYKPKAVVLCLGSDDMGRDVSPITAEDCAANMQKLIENIHKKSGKTKIFYCAVPCYPDRPLSWDVVNAYNGLMKEYCSKKKFLTYLNLGGNLNKGGHPYSPYFKVNHTYLTSSGYSVAKKVIVNKVKKAAK